MKLLKKLTRSIKRFFRGLTLKEVVVTTLLGTLVTSALVIGNNLVNDDNIELQHVKVLDFAKEEKNLIVPKEDYLTDSTIYGNKGEEYSLSFINLSKDLVVALNSDTVFTEDLELHDSGNYIYLYSTREISSFRLVTKGYEIESINANEKGFFEVEKSITTLNGVMPEECWTKLIDEDCTTKEMKDFIEDELHIYFLNIDAYQMTERDNFEDVDTSDVLIMEKLYLFYK